MKKEEKKKKSLKREKRKLNIINYIFYALFFIILFIITIRNGSYFGFDKYLSYLLIFSFILIYLIIKLSNKEKIRIFEEKKINYIFIGFLILFIIYFFTTIYFRATLEELFLWISGILIIYFIYNELKYEENLNIYIKTLLLLGFIISIIPYLEKFKIYSFPGAIVYDKFASIFQYPNTFSSFLLLMLLLSFYEFISSEKILYSILTTFFSITLFLTGSRGGLVVLIIIVISQLILIRKDKIKIFIDSVFLIVFIPILFLFMEVSFGFIISLILSLLIPFLYIFLKNRYKIIYNIYSLIILTSIIFVLLFFSKSNIILNFISLFKKETYIGLSGLSGRNALILTALRIFKNYPVFGTGPGTYQFIYFKYRPELIFSKFPHSMPFQILSEFGILGAILYLSLIFFIVKKTISIFKTDNFLYFGITFGFLGMLIHSFIDFDLSIPAIFYLFFIVLGMLFSIESKGINIKIEKISNVLIIILIFLISISGLYLTSTYYLNIGKSYLNIKDYNNSTIFLKKALSLDSLNSDIHYNLAESYLNLGINNKNLNQIKDANNEYSKATKLNTMFFLYHSGLGNSYLYLNEKNKAIDELKICIDLNPIDSQNYLNLALTYEYFKENSNAKDVLLEAIEKGIENEDIFLELGKIFESENDNINAEKYYKKSIEINKTFDKAYFELGKLYEKLNDIPNAISYLRKAIFLNKNDEYLTEFKKFAPVVEILKPQKDEKIKKGDEIILSWNLSGNDEILSHFSIALYPKGGEYISSFYSDKNSRTFKINSKNLQEGEYYIIIYCASKIPIDNDYLLYYASSDIFIIESQ